MLDEWRGLVSLDQEPIEILKPLEFPRLPTEICEHILNELDSDDLVQDSSGDRARTFAACCLTCRAWLPRSRYHLFKYVIVRSKEQVKQVSKLLRSIPVLRTRVEELHVYGGRDEGRGASWIGLVGFHLGPKLKSLKKIQVEHVDFSTMKLDAYVFWGAFNRAWQPGVTRKLDLLLCTVIHPDQLIRLAFATKAESLYLYSAPPGEQAKPAPPIPALPSSGISLPLSKFDASLHASDLMLPVPWHTLAKQCPYLSIVDIVCWDKNLDISSMDCRTFMVSILCMFHRMRSHNDSSYLKLRIASLPTIEMRTRLRGKSASASNTSLATRPRLQRELVLLDSWSFRFSVEPLVEVLTLLEDAMTLANYINRRFHRIEIPTEAGLNDLQLDSFQPLDGVLSRLLIATPDVHVIIEEKGRPRERCVLPWARERFPALTSVVPNAFCDPESGQPCSLIQNK